MIWICFHLIKFHQTVRKKQKVSNNEQELERTQMTSNDLKIPQLTSTEPTKGNVISFEKKNKNVLKAGSMQENNEINDEYLDEILHYINHWMEIAMQYNSNDKTVRNNAVEYLKEFNSQSSNTQARKGEQLVPLTPAIKKLLI